MTFSEVVSYLFFIALIGGLLALNFWNEIILSYLKQIPHLEYLPFQPSKENLFYTSLLLAFLAILAFWEKERSREALQYSFLTVVTHKFRTPLAGIKWAINGLRDEKTIAERKELIQEIDNASDRISQTVDILTGLAKFSDSLAYAFEAVSLRILVEQGVRKFAVASRLRNISFKLTPSPDTPLIIIDRQKIQFVVDVLLENAIKYSKEGGIVTTSIEQKGRFVYLRVSDEGIGMSSYDRRRIFSRFFRGKDAMERDPDGMGLSLPLVRTVMRHHHGSIFAYSQGRGKGATFIVRFPLR